MDCLDTQCSETQTCECCFKLEMNDYYGDGWNGAYMESYANGIQIGTHQMSWYVNYESTYICMIRGDDFNLDFISVGPHDNEISYVLKDENQTIVASGSHPSAGTIYSASNVCF